MSKNEIWTMGEILVEIMRPKVGMTLQDPDVFLGPYPSGAPAIFIDTAARLGFKSGIIGCVGNDDFGKCVLERLKTDGADIRNVSISDSGSTACAFVTYFEDGSREFIFHLKNTPAVMAKAPEAVPKMDSGYFHIMGCSLTIDPQFCEEIIKAARLYHASGANISFDPNIRPELLKNANFAAIVEPVMEMCEVLLPGAEELLMLTAEKSIEAAVKYIFNRYPVKIIAIKLGSAGCTVYTREEHFSREVFSVEVKDTTGAGDCFDAAFLCGLMEGLSLDKCTEMASAAAALNTAAFGPMEGDISREKVENMIKD